MRKTDMRKTDTFSEIFRTSNMRKTDTFSKVSRILVELLAYLVKFLSIFCRIWSNFSQIFVV